MKKRSYPFGKMSHKIPQFWIEIGIRISLIITFVLLEHIQPFERKIHPEEMWLYKNPVTVSYIPAKTLLWPIVVIFPIAAILGVYALRRDVTDLVQAILSFSLAFGLNGLITDIVKLSVGRPRPDFFFRCFPDGISNPEMRCTGDPDIINEGRKSFPSGHSSFSFASLGFISIYLAGKLGVFNAKGRGQSIRFLAALLPLIAALAVALSRTCDYHHHWQDVLCGSILGLFITYTCYRQYYPPLDSEQADLPLNVMRSSAIGNYDAVNATEVPYKVV